MQDLGRAGGSRTAAATRSVRLIEAFKATYALTDGTVIADAGMLSHDNRVAIEGPGLSYILGGRAP